MTAGLALSRGVLASELTKLRSVRSTWLTVAVAFALSLVFGVLAARSAVHDWPTMSPAERVAFDPVQTSLAGGTWAEFAFGVLGILSISSEYATGLIRTTFLAVPQRGSVLVAKVVVVGGVVLLLAWLLAVAAFFTGQSVLAEDHLSVGLGDPGVVRALTAAGGYLAVLCLVGMAVGAVIRHTAGAVAAWFALIYLAYGFAKALQGWSHVPDRWLLVNIGDSLTRLRPTYEAKVPSLSGAAAELAVYAVVALSLAAWRFCRDV